MAGEELEGWLARHRRRLVDAMAERALKQAVRGAPEPPSGRAAKLAAFLLALLVHLSTVVVAAAGIAVIRLGGAVSDVLGAIVLLLAVFLAPRLWTRDRRTRLGRADLPELFRLLDEVASVARGPVPHAVVVSADFNASASTVRGRRVLEIGGPLWVAAGPQAKVALLGHELGHFAHRDLISTRFVGSAFRTVVRWVQLLTPSSGTHGGLEQLVELAIWVVLAPLRWLGILLAWTFLLLNASAGRRQEFLSDLDAVAAGGTDGATALLDTLLAEEAVRAAVTRAAARADRPDVWELVAQTGSSDAAARAGRRLAAEQERSRMDDSHPRTTLRLRLVELRPHESAQVVLDAGRQALLEQELRPALDVVGRRLVGARR